MYEETCDNTSPRPTPIRLGGAGDTTIPFFVTGTDPDIGGTVAQIVDMTSEAGDFIPSKVGTDGTFIILIEDAAPIEVQLADDSDFTISQIYADKYEGDWIPMKIKKVYKTGTTGTFSVGR
jgi:hypothetical protein